MKREYNNYKFSFKEKRGEPRDIMDVSSRIVNYLADNHISIKDVIEATKIPEEKLKPGGGKLTAEEMLDLCYYLNIRPENMNPFQ